MTLKPVALLACLFLLLANAQATQAQATQAHDARPIRLIAATSLKAALNEVTKAFAKSTGIAVQASFGPSGMMRQQIEEGTPADLFASANMAHPGALHDAGLSGPVVTFARNRICALTQPGLPVTRDTLLDTMLNPDLVLGTATPGADPSGDYAWHLFDRAEAIRPHAGTTLKEKARQLTDGPDSPPPPEGRDTYAWIMTENHADLFLTYCSNATLARNDTPDLRVLTLPEGLSVAASYGLTVMRGAPPEAHDLAMFILSPDGQAILGDYGFTVGRVMPGPGR